MRVGRKNAAVHDEQIRHVPGLSPLIGHRVGGARPHARGADLVNDLAALLERIFRCLVGVVHGAAHGLYDASGGIPPVHDLVEFMLRPAPVKAGYGDAPFVSDARVDVHIAMRVGDHLAAQRQSDVRAVAPTHPFLERQPVTRRAAAYAHAGGGKRATQFKMVAAGKVEFAAGLRPISPPGNEDVPRGMPVLVVTGPVLQRRHVTREAGAR